MAKKRQVLRVLTNSERATFACQKKWDYSYQQGLTEYDTPMPFLHGGLVHEMLAHWYRTQMTASIDEIATQVGEPWLERREAAYEFMRCDVDEKRHEDHKLFDLSLGMVDGHEKEYGDHDREELEIIAVEAAVACQIAHPVSGRRLSDGFDIPIRMSDGSIGGYESVRRNYVYAGQVDLIYRRRSNNATGYMEHKTTVETDLQNFAYKKAMFDPQTRGYALAARKAIKKLSDIPPTKIDEVTYNFLRKKLPREPKLLKPTKAADKKANRSPGVSRAAIDTTPEIYEEFVRRHGFDVEQYRDFFERLNAQFFHRETFSIGDVELANLELDLYHWALQVREASKPTAHHPRQTAICTSTSAAKCPYRMMCMEDDPEGHLMFNVKQVRHEELPGDLAEPWVGEQRAPRRENRKPQALPILTFKDPLRTQDEPVDDDDPDFNW